MNQAIRISGDPGIDVNVAGWGGDSGLYQLAPALGAVEHVIVRDCTPLAGVSPEGVVTNVAHTAEIFEANQRGEFIGAGGFALFQFSDIHNHADVLGRLGYTIVDLPTPEEEQES